MKTFGHSVREGTFLGFMCAYSCAFMLFLAMSLSKKYGYAPPVSFPFLKLGIAIFPPWGFLAVLAGYAHAAKYKVAVDGQFIRLLKNGQEIERRSTHKIIRLRSVCQCPGSCIEFSDEPALVIPWMSPGKLREIRNHVSQLREIQHR